MSMTWGRAFPERAETIFERFRTTRPGGLGLGLPIVRGFMEAQREPLPWLPFPPEPVSVLSFPWWSMIMFLKNKPSFPVL